jgi:DUF4097 and DUF4098 domain-containing protein YvlB
VSAERRPSLTGALLWTGLGVLFLLSNFGIVPDVLMLFRKYWPLLLILLGAGKVIGYLLRKDSVSIRFGEFLSILILIIAGIVITKMSEGPVSRILRQIPFAIGKISIDPKRWFGNSQTFTREAVFPMDSTGPIRIENSHGMVSVASGSDREVRVVLKSVIYAGEVLASGIADKIRIEGECESPSVSAPNPGAQEAVHSPFVVKINEDAWNNDNYRIDADIEVFVPKNSDLQVRNASGDVRVAGIDGTLDLSVANHYLEVRDCKGQFVLSSRYGECRLANLTGNLRLESRSNTHLENHRGDVTIASEFSPISVSKVDGKVAVTIVDGGLIIDSVSQPVVIDAKGGQIKATRLGGSLEIVASHKSVHVEDVASDVRLESRYAAVFLKDIRGKVEIKSDSDRIDADAVAGSITMHGRGSGIRVNEAGGGLNIQTTLKDVFVDDFSGSCNISNEYADVSVSVRGLDKNEIRIKNRSGGIDLYLPERADFSLKAVARQGKVDSFYSGLKTPASTGNISTLESGSHGAGAKISLETEYDNIRIFGAGRDGSRDRRNR